MDHNQVKAQALKTCHLVFCLTSQSFILLTATSHLIGLIFVVYRSNSMFLKLVHFLNISSFTIEQ